MIKHYVLGLSLLVLGATPVFAQEAPAAPATPRNQRQQSVQRVADKLSQESGAKILVSSALSQQLVVAPDTVATAESLEGILDTLVRRVPESTWAKVYLPAPANGRRYTADAVAQFAQAQTGLFGRQVKAEPGTIELLGKRMSSSEAQPYIKGLGLEPYYVLISRRPAIGQLAGGIPGFGTGAGNANPVMDNLMKQLGVSNPKDIPTGDYEVTIPGPDGTPQKAHVSVKNGDGSMSIGVRIGSGG